jgi:hypothetical protein
VPTRHTDPPPSRPPTDAAPASASVAVGFLHTNKTAHGAGRGAKRRIPEATD